MEFNEFSREHKMCYNYILLSLIYIVIYGGNVACEYLCGAPRNMTFVKASRENMRKTFRPI